VIVDHAASIKADYLAMATHGRTGLRRLLLGSVAELVVRNSHVPVVLYPPPA
jgi:nucleotide-binding universal stress UspA family protein